MDEELIRLLNDVGILALVPPNHKICLKTRKYVRSDSFWSGLVRWYSSEDQRATCEFVEKTVTKLFRFYDLYKQTSPNSACIILEKFDELSKGIEVLAKTYSNLQNPDTTSSLRTMLRLIAQKKYDIQKENIPAYNPEVLGTGASGSKDTSTNYP